MRTGRRYFFKKRIGFDAPDLATAIILVAVGAVLLIFLAVMFHEQPRDLPAWSTERRGF